MVDMLERHSAEWHDLIFWHPIGGLTCVVQRSKCMFSWGLIWEGRLPDFIVPHCSLRAESWCFQQQLGALRASPDTTDGARAIEKETAQEFGCLGIYCSLVAGFGITQRTGRHFPSTCPCNYCDLRQWTEAQVWYVAARAPVWGC